jgi:tRNA nucleotidyltransferase (CCA-adding enzyme)
MSNITINIPKGAAAIIDTLQSNGFEAYLVGGCVRDSILKRPVHDWDITTSATPDEMKKVFADTKIIETGIKHGTLTILSVDGFYECTTYRIDGAYSDGRHPDIVRFTKSLTEDLKRRDFTINAMAYNDKEGLIDLFGGRLDLMDHVIRCVGNPEDRFKEDALRIMRALRFAAQLEFDLEMKTKIAAFQMSDTLTKVSAERINSEFCKILTQPMGSQVINNYKEIIAVFIPEIRDMFDFEQNNPYHMFNVWDHTIEVLARAALFMDPNNLALTLAAFFHDIGKPHSYQDGPDGIRHFYGHAAKSAEMTDSIMRRMRFNNSIREQVVTLVKYHDADIKPEAKYIKRWLNKLDSESLLKCLFMLKYADISGQAIKGRTERLKVINHLFAVRCDILKQQACFSLKDLAVNGNDLIAAGMKPGKEIGAILNQMLELVLNDECANDKDALFKAVGIE